MFSSSSISDEGKYSSAELSSDSQGIEVVFFSWRGYKRKEKKTQLFMASLEKIYSILGFVLAADKFTLSIYFLTFQLLFH